MSKIYLHIIFIIVSPTTICTLGSGQIKALRDSSKNPATSIEQLKKNITLLERNGYNVDVQNVKTILMKREAALRSQASPDIASPSADIAPLSTQQMSPPPTEPDSIEQTTPIVSQPMQPEQRDQSFVTIRRPQGQAGRRPPSRPSSSAPLSPEPILPPAQPNQEPEILSQPPMPQPQQTNYEKAEDINEQATAIVEDIIENILAMRSTATQFPGRSNNEEWDPLMLQRQQAALKKRWDELTLKATELNQQLNTLHGTFETLKATWRDRNKNDQTLIDQIEEEFNYSQDELNTFADEQFEDATQPSINDLFKSASSKQWSIIYPIALEELRKINNIIRNSDSAQVYYPYALEEWLLTKKIIKDSAYAVTEQPTIINREYLYSRKEIDQTATYSNL